MSKSIPFLSPRMVGRRFEEHAIPLELLKDLAVLEEMIVEIAKWCYRQDHQDRKRLPKGFTEGIALKLTGVCEGSAVPQLKLFVDHPHLFPTQGEYYFEKAKDRLIGAINAAEHDEPITPYLSDDFLGYFDRIGRGLREDEAIEFAPQAIDRKARLNKATRRKLVLASSQIQELTEEVCLRGSIPEANQDKMTFELQVINGPKVISPIASQHLQTVLEAFNGYQFGMRVLLQGVGRYNRSDRLQCIETVEHMSVLESNDVFARLEELKVLSDGWLDGKIGFAPSTTGLDWLAESFKHKYPEELPTPYLYPTAEGGIQAEWSVGGKEITLEINIDLHQGEWHELDLNSEVDTAKNLNLDEIADWHWLVTELEKLNGRAE